MLRSCADNPVRAAPFSSSFARGVMMVPGLIVFSYFPSLRATSQRDGDALTLRSPWLCDRWILSVPIAVCLNRGGHPIPLCPFLCPPYFKIGHNLGCMGNDWREGGNRQSAQRIGAYSNR